ncbi:DUF4396 domain-containing protein [Shewanella surugensis]|uniref:DUF4396 domain-containing protein n=1 Tax=Shewanella surugensis TaxID=212020 RepID=A0ABT0LAC8_9GAMM|nr:DUF4396 domain-containing protein [Shewanella surugensis]MCL1124618.1 DUF4396 domain-containing protein [Shewanella surugensis]
MSELYGALILWFSLTFLSMIYVLWDQFTNTPSMRIMTFAWVLIILYTGPLGLFFYFLSCRQPLEGKHDEFINVHWKQSLGSLIHCVAGDATAAIIIMAIVLTLFSIANGLEMILEYIAAYLFGLFIFQALFMRSMFDSYWEAVRKTLFAETISMNFVMCGMLPTMFILAHLFPLSTDPNSLYFWGRMSLATIIASFVAYPINAWMVRNNIKHGMMSRPQASDSKHAHNEHNMHTHAHEHEVHDNLEHDDKNIHRAHDMKADSISFTKQAILISATFALLLIIIWLTTFIIPIKF